MRVASRAWIWFLCAGGLGLGGCMRESPGQEPRLAALEEEAARMDAALDAVEDRLIVGRAQVALWDELATRHRTVSQVACENAEVHMQGISRHFEKTEEVLKKKAHRRRVARAGRRAAAKEAPEVTASEGGVGGPAEGE